MKGLISVIIPVYNVENYLEKCLLSVLNQTYSKLEIILINDGSTDNSPNICQKYEKIDKRIKYISKNNEGLSATRNLGIKIAKGELIAFVDSDDVLSLNMYEILYKNLIINKADLSICEVTRFTDEPNFTIDNEVHNYNQTEALKILLQDELMCNYAVNKLIKTKLIKNIQFPLNVYLEDVGTIYKYFLTSKKIVYTGSKLYGYRQRTDSITKNINLKFYQDYFQMLELRSNDLQNKNIDDYITLSLVNVILGMFIDISRNKKILNDYKFKQLADQKYILLKKLNLKVKYLNTIKKNILIKILLFNRNIFYVAMKIYLYLKEKIVI